MIAFSLNIKLIFLPTTFFFFLSFLTLLCAWDLQTFSLALIIVAEVQCVHVQPARGPSLSLFQVQWCDYSCLTCCTIGSSACPDNGAVMFTVLAALAITSHYTTLIIQALTFQ